MTHSLCVVQLFMHDRNILERSPGDAETGSVIVNAINKESNNLSEVMPIYSLRRIG